MTEPKAPALVRTISRFDLTAAIVNGVIGSAIFSMPSTQAALTGALSPLVCLIAGAGVLTIVLCFAEVASRFREGGGPYLYARQAFSPAVGFQAGWFTFWIRVTALAANLNAFADYGATLVPAADPRPWRLFLMATVAAFAAGVNVIGVRQASWTVNAFTMAKLLPLGLLVILGLPRLSAGAFATQAVARPDWTHAVLLLMFAYGGFESPLIPAGEARDPSRDTGPALLTALAAIALVYTLVQLVVVGVLPHAASSTAPLASTFEVILGPAGAVFASVAALVSIYGYTMGTTLQSPRLLHAMAVRGELPRVLARVHEGFRTPDAAIVVFASFAFGLAAAGSFAANATFSAIVRLVTYALTCAALVVLRRKHPSEPPAFRVPGGTLVASLGLGFCVWLLMTRSLDRPGLIALGLLALIAVAGLGLRALARRAAVRSGGDSAVV
jgi:amino acid transporter